MMRYKRNITPDTFPYMTTVATSQNPLFPTTIMDDECIFSGRNRLLKNIYHLLCDERCNRLLERKVYEVDHDL